MVGIDGLLGGLDGRPFASLWYWLLLTGVWTWLGRGALGVPSDLVAAVRRLDRKGGGTDADPLSLTLLDWLSLVTPRWRVDPREGAALLGFAAFVLTVMALLGFVYGLATAQGLTLLVAPLVVLAALRVRLAAALAATLAEAQAGRLSPRLAAARAARRITVHLRVTLALSALAVGGAAVWGVAWMIRHPNGL